MVFPWVEEYLEELHSSQKKLLDNTIDWMIKDNPLKAATNIAKLDASLATYIGDLYYDQSHISFQSNVLSLLL